MANGAINLVNLDFDSLKQSLKTYLSSQNKFVDYDFEGSNMSVLLDVLSYNTYLNTFYLNMVASEMFLDSAQLRDSIISHAKELNYLPRSFRSAKSSINLTITPTDPGISSVTIPRGASFTSKVGANTFTFTVPDNVILTSSTGIFNANNLSIFEGTFITDSFVFDSSSNNQRFVLSNPTIDTTSLRVYVTEDNGSQVILYEQASSFLNVTPSSRVFFVQAAEDDKFEIVFGNGTFGRRPKDASIISAVYRICNGELPNGCSLFSADSSIDGHSNVAVRTVESAFGGLVHETNQSIKLNAPRFFQTQERAVTANDYKTLLQIQFPEIVSVSVYGGEEADPPQFGKVIISLNVAGQDRVSEGQKEAYASYIDTISPLSIDPVFVEPEYLNVEVNTLVKFNTSIAGVSIEDINTLVSTKIKIYNENFLNKFQSKIRGSALFTDIDEVDRSIISNETKFRVYKELVPNTISGSLNNFIIKVNNKLAEPLHVPSSGNGGVTVHSFQSSSFSYLSERGEIARAILEDDGTGIVHVVSFDDPTHPILRSRVGTIDYINGRVTISNLPIESFEGRTLKFFFNLSSTDVFGRFNDILRIRDADIVIRSIGERE
jgi:hypothetical protein